MDRAAVLRIGRRLAQEQHTFPTTGIIGKVLTCHASDETDWETTDRRGQAAPNG
ncbi:MAG: hypothetical protein ACRD4Q_02195 [Candidatus Acidiferrales bacterium]